jgi:hypothetical protein
VTAAKPSPITTSVSQEKFPQGGGTGGTVTAETVAGCALEFEGTLCSRCGGSGRIARYGHVRRGVCFGCEGAGGQYTDRGAAAQARFGARCAAVLPVLRESIRAGDIVWYRMRGLGAWVPVADVRDDGRPGETRITAGDDVRVIRYRSHLTITVDHPAGRVGVIEGTGQRYTIPRWDAGQVAAIVNEVAAMPGAALHPASPQPGRQPPPGAVPGAGTLQDGPGR